MLEIPESATISRQAATILVGKRIKEVFNASSPHGFAWYNGDPKGYNYQRGLLRWSNLFLS